MRAILLVCAFAAIAVTACKPQSPARSSDASDRAAIEAIAKAHAKAYYAGDLDAIVAAYAEDAVVMPPDAPVAKGRDAIRKLFTASMATAKPGQSESYEDHSVEVSGDMGWDSGVSRVRDANGTVIWSGHFLAVWRKKEGNWQTVRDIWTNDPPEKAN